MALDIRLVNETASALGVTPEELLTIMSYETAGTLDPTQAGPTTKYGQHRGLIQFGEPQAKQYGVDWNDPMKSQLGKEGAIVKYALASGYKPGMGMMDLYSTINAGAPGRYNARDAAAGGAPGTVADKVNNQMSAHRAKAQKFLAENPTTDTSNPITDYSINPSEATAATTALRKDTSNPISGYGGGPNGPSAVPTPTPAPAAPAKDERTWLAKLMSGFGKGTGKIDTAYGVSKPPAITPTQTTTRMTPGQAAPTLNPNTVNMQRQQMAQALARLNSGQLFLG